jgi:outer membrane protein insertion porin family
MKFIQFCIVICAVFLIDQTGFAQIELGNSNIDYAEPRKMKIAGITVLGAEFTDPQAIKLFAGLQVGQELMIPGDEIADAVRKLWTNQL